MVVVSELTTTVPPAESDEEGQAGRPIVVVALLERVISAAARVVRPARLARMRADGRMSESRGVAGVRRRLQSECVGWKANVFLRRELQEAFLGAREGGDPKKGWIRR